MEKNTKNTEMKPVRVPVLALRGLVLFPHMVLHFDVGREKSLHALNMAMNGDRKIFLVAQIDQNEENPSMDGLYKVGTVAEIRQIVRSQGESLRVLVEGCYRGKLIDMFEEDHTSVGEILPAALRAALSVMRWFALSRTSSMSISAWRPGCLKRSWIISSIATIQRLLRNT